MERQRGTSIEPVSDELTPFSSEKIKTSKLDQSTRVVKMDVYCTMSPFKRTPGTKVEFGSLDFFRTKIVSSHQRPALPRALAPTSETGGNASRRASPAFEADPPHHLDDKAGSDQ